MKILCTIHAKSHHHAQRHPVASPDIGRECLSKGSFMVLGSKFCKIFWFNFLHIVFVLRSSFPPNEWEK